MQEPQRPCAPDVAGRVKRMIGNGLVSTFEFYDGIDSNAIKWTGRVKLPDDFDEKEFMNEVFIEKYGVDKMKLFLDTDVAIDVISAREPFFRAISPSTRRRIIWY